MQVNKDKEPDNISDAKSKSDGNKTKIAYTRRPLLRELFHEFIFTTASVHKSEFISFSERINRLEQKKLHSYSEFLIQTQSMNATRKSKEEKKMYHFSAFALC